MVGLSWQSSHHASRRRWPAAPRPIESGRIVVGRGVHGVTLGMTRAQVVARLGRPISQNAIGYMDTPRKHLFDVYVRRGRRSGPTSSRPRSRVLLFRRDLLADEGEPEATASGASESGSTSSWTRRTPTLRLRHPQPLPRAAGEHGLLARTSDRSCRSTSPYADPGEPVFAGLPALGARPSAAGRSEEVAGRSPLRVLRPHRRRGHVRRSTVPRAAGRASVPAARKRRRGRLRHVSALPLRGRRRRMVGGGLLAAALGRRRFRRVVPEGEWGLARVPPADRPPPPGGPFPLFRLSPLGLRVRVAHDRLPGFVVLGAVAALVPLPALVVHAAYPLVDAEPAPEPLAEGRGAPAHFRFSFT